MPEQFNVRLHESWQSRLGAEFEQPYMQNLFEFLQAESAAGKVIHPAPAEWFNALNSTPFSQVKVVILGQDPYPTPGHAHGLCFSVQPGVHPPKSLINIYKEMVTDVGVQNESGYLQPWAEQGVLMLNAVLTVESGQAASHQKRGWETFTDKVIQQLSDEREGLVFLLWGAHARRKGMGIDRKRHHILEAPHPSPLSAYRGFFGSRPFSQINQWLESRGEQGINWQL